MKRYLFLLLSIGCVSAALAYGANPKPNVLFIICDDLNTHVSTSNYPHMETPAFEALAESGITFKRAYCQYPVCNPSRTSFLHGLYPQSTGIIRNDIDIRDVRPELVSLPQLYKESGYWTGGVGKVFHGRYDHGERTWHEYHMFENDEMPMVTPIREAFEAEHGPFTEGESRKLWRAFYPTIAPQTRGQKPGYGPTGLRDEQHKDGKNVRKVIEWLENESFGEAPFFIAAGIHKPHGPFLAPDKYFEMNPKEDLVFETPPADFWDQAPRSAMTKRFERFGFVFEEENEPLRREYMQAYHACISFIDAQIGLVFDALRRTGQWDNTIIVLISDHGYHLGDHWMWGKTTLFEISARVPMVVRVPGLTMPGSQSQGLVELVDLYPTLVELCRLEPPDNLQGVSVVPMLEEPSAPGKEAIYTVVRRGDMLGKAIRTQRWRYGLWADGEELYDLEEDPGELRNLASERDYKETLDRMRVHLASKDRQAASESLGPDLLKF